MGYLILFLGYKRKIMKMKFYVLVALCGTTMISCDDVSSEHDDDNNGTQAKYTYELNSWENTDSTTSVFFNVNNSSELDQNIMFTLEVLNDSGATFILDTTVQFTSDERDRDIEVTLETFGSIDTVMLSASDY